MDFSDVIDINVHIFRCGILVFVAISLRPERDNYLLELLCSAFELTERDAEKKPAKPANTGSNISHLHGRARADHLQQAQASPWLNGVSMMVAYITVYSLRS